MWQLHMTNHAKEWVSVGSFETMTAATRRIIDIEGKPVSGIHLEMYVYTKGGSDDEAFGHLEYTGRKALYLVKRCVN